MDFSQAGLLIAAVFAVTKGIDKAIPKLTGAPLQLVAFLVGIAMTFLVAYSTYADGVTVGGKTLDVVNTAGLILIGLLVAGGATVVDQLFKSVTNIGENQPPPT